MNHLHILYFLLPIIGWSLPNFFIKNLRKIFNSVEIIVLLHLIYHIIILPSLIITYFNKREKINSFYKKIKSIDKFTLMSGFMIVIFGLGAQFGFNSLIKYYDVTYTVPIIRGFSSILLVVFGYFIFKEAITIKKLCGILLVILGVYLMTSK